jgi:hypothetical protein
MQRVLKIILFLLLISFPDSLFSGDEASLVSAGEQNIYIYGAGYSTAAGSFSNALSGGYNLYLGLDSPSSIFGFNYLINAGLNYSSFNVASNDNSIFEIFSIRAGIGGLYPLTYGLSLYSGLAPEFSLVQYISDGHNAREQYYRPSICLSTGVDWQSATGFGIRPEVRYRALPFGSGILHDVSIFAGVTFRQSTYAGWSSSRQSDTSDVKQQTSYDRAESFYTKGNFIEARKEAEKITAFNPADEKAGGLLSRIEDHEKNYRRAVTNIEAGRKFEALPYLESALPMTEAADQINKLKTELLPRVPALEQAGIKAYNEMNYDQCIYYMNSIKSIDPYNKTVRLYLPRAEQRKRAQQKLN